MPGSPSLGGEAPLGRGTTMTAPRSFQERRREGEGGRAGGARRRPWPREGHTPQTSSTSATDAQTMYQRWCSGTRCISYGEERGIKPETFASLVSALLYEKRFGPYFCQPVIAGLGDDKIQFICTMDCIGANLRRCLARSAQCGAALWSLIKPCWRMTHDVETWRDSPAQHTVNPASQGLVSEIGLEMTNTSCSLILHLRPDKRADGMAHCRREPSRRKLVTCRQGAFKEGNAGSEG